MASSVERDGIEYISYQQNRKANLNASISTKNTTKAGTFTSTPRRSHAITHQVPSTEIRVRAMGREPIAATMCSCTAVRRCTASTCSEVGLALRAIWTTSWLAEPNGWPRTIHTGRAHRLPQLHCRRSNSQLQRRTLSRSLERPQRSAVPQVRVPLSD